MHGYDNVYRVADASTIRGLVFKKCNILHYLYVQDLWPKNVEIVTEIHNKFAIGVISKMVRYIYRNSDKMFGISFSIVADIKRNVKIRIKFIIARIIQKAFTTG